MRSFAPLAVLLAACSADFDVPDQSSAGAPAVSVEPMGSTSGAPAVFRLRVEGGAKRSALSDYRLFSGELGAYHLGRIKRRELPATLLAREIPLLTWALAKDVVVAPLAVLESGKYALATPELGLVTEVVVDEALVPVLERAWPPADATVGSGLAVFCGEAAGTVASGPVELAPTAVPASIAPGLDDEGAFSTQCVRVEPKEMLAAGTPLLPPALAGGAALEPRVLLVANAKPEQVACPDPEIALGPTCGAVADDRIELHTYEAPVFVAFEKPRPLLGAIGPGRSLVLGGFDPATTARVTGVAFDALGERTRIDLEVLTAPARPHLVLNEVLANPAGPETSSEWVEIVNDGARPIELEGFVLDDAIEPVALPASVLAPGQMALLVPEGYFPDSELDLVPPSDAALIVLPRLGRSGLANAGELLRLRDRDGNVISRFPARAAPGPGQSVARRTPDSPDEESASFADHAAPGASPGRANVVEDE